ncbi:MAG: efflux RND transporter periplasmic adaptor subunit [Pseudomonadota bacterium]|nr:efflux RND transporter periplasmic adaptor subunit [Pseudomonadota bacterium]
MTLHKNIFWPALAAALLLAGCGSTDSAKPAEEHTEDGHDDHAAHEEAGEHDEHAEGEGHGEHAEALTLSPEARKTAGIVTAPAGPGTLVESILLYGTLQPNAERVRSVIARFPGVVRELSSKVGDSVTQGQVLARIESNESLQVYAVASPIAGVITERLANPGEQAGSNPLFTVTNLSTLWAEMSFFPRDRASIRVGQRVRLQAADAGLSGEGRIVYLSPLGSAATQSLTARVLLENQAGLWSPGLYVRGDVAVGESKVPLAVPAEAVQELEAGPAVYVEDADGFEARPVKLGRSDGRTVEVLEGLSGGDMVVVEGGFVLKAEQGKGEAEHEH